MDGFVRMNVVKELAEDSLPDWDPKLKQVPSVTDPFWSNLTKCGGSGQSDANIIVG